MQNYSLLECIGVEDDSNLVAWIEVCNVCSVQFLSIVHVLG